MTARRLIAALGWTLIAACFLLSLLMFLPAPTMLLWMASLAAGEWSLWLIPVALVGGVMALVWPTRSMWARMLPIPFILLITLAALTPVIAAHRIVGREEADISLGRYLFGRTMPDVETLTGIGYGISSGHGAGVSHAKGRTGAKSGTDSLRLDIYRPAGYAVGQSGPMPAAVVIHGGSWRGGTRSELAGFDRWLAGTGRIVLDIDYTLAREGAHSPTQERDVRAALVWVRRNAARLGIDTGDVILVGRSAGGQLALLAAGDANRAAPARGAGAPLDTTRAASDTISDDRPVRVRAVVSFYAPTDLIWGYEHPARPDIIDARGVLENYIGGTPATHAEAYRFASPVARFDAAMPPTLLIHGGRDRIVPVHHLWMAEKRLKELNVPSRALYLPWADHGFDVNTNGFASQISQRVILDFLEKR